MGPTAVFSDLTARAKSKALVFTEEIKTELKKHCIYSAKVLPPWKSQLRTWLLEKLSEIVDTFYLFSIEGLDLAKQKDIANVPRSFQRIFWHVNFEILRTVRTLLGVDNTGWLAYNMAREPLPSVRKTILHLSARQ